MMLSGTYTRGDVDHLYRDLPEVDAMWLKLPSVDELPRQRRPQDELPMEITEYLTLMEALERLTHTQRIVFRAVVMGVVRTYDGRRMDYVDVKITPMTYEQCARFMDLSRDSVSQALFRARQKLAKILSDREGE